MLKWSGAKDAFSKRSVQWNGGLSKATSMSSRVARVIRIAKVSEDTK